MANSSLYITGHGSFPFDDDLYAKAMRQTKAQLYARVWETLYGDGYTATELRKLRKHELAAMIADWETGERDSTRHLARMDAEREAAADTVTRPYGPCDAVSVKQAVQRLDAFRVQAYAALAAKEELHIGDTAATSTIPHILARVVAIDRTRESVTRHDGPLYTVETARGHHVTAPRGFFTTAV